MSGMFNKYVLWGIENSVEVVKPKIFIDSILWLKYSLPNISDI